MKTTEPCTLRAGILLDHPSPHMVGLLDALAKRVDCAAQVVYFRPGSPGRRWGDPAGGLPHRFAATHKDSVALVNVHAVVRAMADVRADIWVVSTCYTAPETWAAVAWLNRAGLPWVYMNEPLRPRGRIGKVKEALLRWMLRHSAGVIGMGREVQAWYAELAGAPKPSASVPYYVDLGEFLGLSIPGAPGEGEPVGFFTASQMIERKGIDVLLAACQRLPEAGWTLSLAGAGPLRTQLEEAFRQRWGPQQVSFLGEVPYSERKNAFAGQHVFVFPSRWDGWGMAPVEAMAAGLPVISTDQVMSMREFLSEARNGYLVASEDPEALAERMQWFIEHPEQIPVMGRAARTALAEYRPDDGAARLVNFLSMIDRTAHRTVTESGGKSHDESNFMPNWQTLTEPSRAGPRVRQHVRALAKRSLIDASMAMPWRASAPHGHRILVYHLVLREDRKRFQDHLMFLRDHYRLVTVRELVRALGQGDGSAMAAISFDDGFRVLMSDALELLEKHNVKASFYVPTGFIELGGDSLKSAEYSVRAHYYRQPLQPMNVDDLRRLESLGHEIGSHGVSHLSLNDVSSTLAAHELCESRGRLNSWLGEAPVGFAYPYGEVKSSVGDPTSWVTAASYEYAVTLRRGALHATTDLMQLPRDHAEGNWRVRDLRYFLSR